MQRRSLIKNLALITGGLSVPSALKAQLSNRPIRIAHITDTHIQPHIGAAKGFEKCLHHIQSLDHVPDMLINGGDAIMGLHGASENSIDRQWDLFGKVLKSENGLPIHHCVGNHDIFRKDNNKDNFESGKLEAMNQLEIDKSYYEINKENWKILVLDSIQSKTEGKGYQGKIDEKQFNWLKSRLEQSQVEQKFVMIVSHIPILSACVFLDGKNFKNGEWRVPETWMHGDAEELIELFDNYPNIKLAISGHIHLNDRIDYNSVTYVCNGAVSGNWWMGNYKKTAPGYALIDLFPDGTFSNQYLKYS
ncbi:MAG: metallophosphoesterase [Cytophagaceae bacterium]|nr:metallophosphoesterase [Cytophagaceae bacterium]